jgi:hypothetical protein
VLQRTQGVEQLRLCACPDRRDETWALGERPRDRELTLVLPRALANSPRAITTRVLFAACSAEKRVK